VGRGKGGGLYWAAYRHLQPWEEGHPGEDEKLDEVKVVSRWGESREDCTKIGVGAGENPHKKTGSLRRVNEKGRKISMYNKDCLSARVS